MQDCLGSNTASASATFSSAPCPSAKLVGVCRLSQTQEAHYFYEPASLEVSKGSCAADKGVWSDT
jgi:hypothetical protein